MSDELDQTAERLEFDISVSVKNACEEVNKIPKGCEGDCDLCGEHFSRVVETQYQGNDILACGRCRDKHRLS